MSPELQEALRKWEAKKKAQATGAVDAVALAAAPAVAVQAPAPSLPVTQERGGTTGGVLHAARVATAPVAGEPRTPEQVAQTRAAETSHPVVDAFGAQAAPYLRQAETGGLAELPVGLRTGTGAATGMLGQVKSSLRPQVQYGEEGVLDRITATGRGAVGLTTAAPTAPDAESKAAALFTRSGADLRHASALDAEIKAKAILLGLPASAVNAAMRGGLTDLGLSGGPDAAVRQIGMMSALYNAIVGATEDIPSSDAVLSADVFDLSDSERVVAGMTDEQRALAQQYPELGGLIERRNGSVGRAWSAWTDAVRGGRSENAAWYLLRTLGNTVGAHTAIGAAALTNVAERVGKTEIGTGSFAGDLGLGLATGGDFSAALSGIAGKVGTDADLPEATVSAMRTKAGLWGVGLSMAGGSPSAVRGIVTNAADLAGAVGKVVRVADVAVDASFAAKVQEDIADEMLRTFRVVEGKTADVVPGVDLVADPAARASAMDAASHARAAEDAAAHAAQVATGRGAEALSSWRRTADAVSRVPPEGGGAIREEGAAIVDALKGEIATLANRASVLSGEAKTADRGVAATAVRAEKARKAIAAAFEAETSARSSEILSELAADIGIDSAKPWAAVVARIQAQHGVVEAKAALKGAEDAARLATVPSVVATQRLSDAMDLLGAARKRLAETQDTVSANALAASDAKAIADIAARALSLETRAAGSVATAAAKASARAATTSSDVRGLATKAAQAADLATTVNPKSGVAPWASALAQQRLQGAVVPIERVNAAAEAEMLRRVRAHPSARPLTDLPAREAVAVMDPVSVGAAGSVVEKLGMALLDRTLGRTVRHPIFKEVETELRAALDAGRGLYDKTTNDFLLGGGMEKGAARLRATFAPFASEPGQLFDDFVRLAYAGIDTTADVVKTAGGLSGEVASGSRPGVATTVPTMQRVFGNLVADPEGAERILLQLSKTKAFGEARDVFVRLANDGKVEDAIGVLRQYAARTNTNTLADLLADVGGYASAVVRRGEAVTDPTMAKIGVIAPYNIGEALHAVGLRRWQYVSLDEAMKGLDERWQGALLGRQTLEGFARRDAERLGAAVDAGVFQGAAADFVKDHAGALWLAAARYHSGEVAAGAPLGNIVEGLQRHIFYKMEEVGKAGYAAAVDALGGKAIVEPLLQSGAMTAKDVLQKGAALLAAQVDALGVGREFMEKARVLERVTKATERTGAYGVSPPLVANLNESISAAKKALYTRVGAQGVGPTTVSRLIDEVAAFDPSVAASLRRASGIKDVHQLLEMWTAQSKFAKGVNDGLLIETVLQQLPGLGLRMGLEGARQMMSVAKNGMLGGVGPLVNTGYIVKNATGAPMIVALQQGAEGVAGLFHPAVADVMEELYPTLRRVGKALGAEDVAGKSAVLFTRGDGAWTAQRIADEARRANLQSSQVHAELMRDLGSLLVDSGLAADGSVLAGSKAGKLWKAAQAIIDDFSRARRGPSAANQFANATDTHFRLGTFINALERGDDVETAIRLARDAQLDYGALPSWFKQTVGRVVWFSMFRAASARATLRAVVRHPGMVLAPDRLQHAMARVNSDVLEDDEFRDVNPWTRHNAVVRLLKDDEVNARFATELPGTVAAGAMQDIVALLSILGPMAGDDPQRGMLAQAGISARRAVDYAVDQLPPPVRVLAGTGARAVGAEVSDLGIPPKVDGRLVDWAESAGIGAQFKTMFGLVPDTDFGPKADARQRTATGLHPWKFNDVGVDGKRNAKIAQNNYDLLKLTLLMVGQDRALRDWAFVVSDQPSASPLGLLGMATTELKPEPQRAAIERGRLANNLERGESR